MILDQRGARCPAPIIALGRWAASLPDAGGGEVELLADDPAARFDVPAWCDMRGATLLRCDPGDAAEPWQRYLIRLPGAPNAAGRDTNTGSPDR